MGEYRRRTARLTLDELEDVVAEALDTLPPRFADLAENVVVTVEEEPSDDDLASLDDDDGEHDGDGEILGIYRGVALTERVHGAEPLVPDEIAIFRGPINRVARTRREAVDEVRTTVIHELGHYFGLHDDELP